MGVSRATFGRIVQRARQAVADALINGKAINVEGGSYNIISSTRLFYCNNCNQEWEEPLGTGRPKCCPSCKADEFHRIGKKTEPSQTGIE
jgi:Zn finger protein HypA/HybF involved in hydrogenase expression